MSNTLVYIHIGYPKAASTSLQQNLFNKHPELNFLGPRCEGFSEIGQKSINRKTLESFWVNLCKTTTIEYQGIDNTRNYKECILPYLETEKPNIFSYEDILVPWFSENGLKAYRIKTFFPEAKIIIIIRNQLDLLKSFYLQLQGAVPLAPPRTINDKALSFNDWIEINLKAQYIHVASLLKSLDFYQTISFYRDLFGSDNICILLFEDLLNNPNQFAKELAHFMEIDPIYTQNFINSKPQNTSNLMKQTKLYKSRYFDQIKLSQILPNLIYNPLYNILEKALTEYVPIKPSLNYNKEHLNKIRDLYRDSNQKLINDFGLDIRKYDYIL